MYRQIINEIDPQVNAVHVEAHMRLEYGTLDHLSRGQFVREIKLFRACEREQPGYGAAIAASYGLR